MEVPRADNCAGGQAPNSAQPAPWRPPAGARTPSFILVLMTRACYACSRRLRIARRTGENFRQCFCPFRPFYHPYTCIHIISSYKYIFFVLL